MFWSSRPAGQACPSGLKPDGGAVTNRYDNETLKLLAERGPIGERLIRGLIWAVIAIFIISVLAFLIRVFGPPPLVKTVF